MTLQEALDKTDPMKTNTVTQGSVEERLPLNGLRISRLLYTGKCLAKIRHVYAENAYYFDPFKELNGIDAIEAHFIRLLKPVESCTFEFLDMRFQEATIIFGGFMDAKFKTFKKGQVFRSYGMTHIRFDETGKVIFHMDYWDSASGLLEHIPLLGGLIKFIKRKV